jgi:DNA-binding NtrC family response regulator
VSVSREKMLEEIRRVAREEGYPAYDRWRGRVVNKQAIYLEFGSWRNALAAAGVEPRERGKGDHSAEAARRRAETLPVMEALAARIEGGETMRAVAEDIGMHVEALRQKLRRYGLRPRTQRPGG